MNEIQKELVELAIEQVSLNGGRIRVDLYANKHVDISLANGTVVLES